MSLINTSRALVDAFHRLPGGGAGPVAYRFLHAHGRAMPVAPENATYTRRGPMGDCYRNSLHAALRTGMTYCEGYAVAGRVGIPLEHAWLCDAQGRVVDPTWPDGADYFGVPFNEEFHADFVTETGYHGILCNLYLHPLACKRQNAQAVLDFLAQGVAQLEGMTA